MTYGIFCFVMVTSYFSVSILFLQKFPPSCDTSSDSSCAIACKSVRNVKIDIETKTPWLLSDSLINANRLILMACGTRMSIRLGEWRGGFLDEASVEFACAASFLKIANIIANAAIAKRTRYPHPLPRERSHLRHVRGAFSG